MAGPPKKKAVEPKDDDSSSGDESDSGSYQGGEEIQADFEGRNPEGQDFHGIKQLLQQLFLKAHINLSDMSDLIIAQQGIGSVLKQSTYDEDEDDEDDNMTDSLDVFGITTVLNLTNPSGTSCIKQFNDLVKELSEQHADSAVHAEICNIFSNSNKIGLLINERFVNIPPKIADPLLTSLMGEIDRIKKKESRFDFDYYVMICKLHKPKGNKVGDIFYANAEEEIFEKEAKLSFEFCVQNESDTSVAGKWKEGDVEMIPYRKVLFINANKFNNIVQQIKQFVN